MYFFFLIESVKWEHGEFRSRFIHREWMILIIFWKKSLFVKHLEFRSSNSPDGFQSAEYDGPSFWATVAKLEKSAEPATSRGSGPWRAKTKLSSNRINGPPLRFTRKRGTKVRNAENSSKYVSSRSPPFQLFLPPPELARNIIRDARDGSQPVSTIVKRDDRSKVSEALLHKNVP